MNLIFLTLIDINDIQERGIYQDLLRKFRDEGHNVYIISPSERRQGKETRLMVKDNVSLLKVRTFNIQKTNIVEKGIGTLLLEHQYLNAFKKYFGKIRFDLVLYSTPPITLTKVINYVKGKDKAFAYLLLKDIFPQNAIDLNLLKKDGVLHRYFLKKEKQLYKISDAIGCMSPANVNFIVHHNPEINKDKVEVNPNSISPVCTSLSASGKFAIREKYKIPADSIAFIYGGNLGKPQGINFLIEALKANAENNKAFFLIVGNGTEYSKIARWYNQSGQKNVTLLQSLPKNEYDELIQACDVGLIFLDFKFTIPNFPSRLLSYLENKMPIIAATDIHTDIGRIVESAGCGYWSESNNLEAFNRNVRLFIDVPERIAEMGMNGYRLLNKNYTVSISYDKIRKHLR